jgi:translation initiation factor IF-2
MSIRLNKVTRDLNVGITTLVGFLQKKGHTVENNPNARITEEEYEMLVREFSQDMNLKQEAERLVQERISRDKQKVVETPVKEEPKVATAVKPEEPKKVEPEAVTADSTENKPHIKLVGSIDLDALNKKPKPAAPKQEEVHNVVENKVVETTPEVKPEVKPEIKLEVKPEVKPEAKPVVNTEVTLEIKSEEKPEVKSVEKPIEEVKVVKPEPKPESKPEPVITKVVEEKIPEPVKKEETVEVKVEKEIKQEKHQVKPVQEKKESSFAKPKPNIIEKKEVVAAEPASESTESSEPELFRLGDNKIESNIKVIKTIDLDSLNQSTRPKKKTQAEKRKEREEKFQSEKSARQQNRPGEVKKPVAATDDQKKINKPNINPGQTPNQTQSNTSLADQKKKKRSRIKDGKVRVNDTQSPNQGQHRPGQATQEFKSKLKKPVLKTEISSEDVSKQIKETLARLTTKPKKGTKYRKEKREAGSLKRMEEAEREEQDSKIIKITEFVTVNDLANMMDVPVVKVISICMSIGQMVSINQRLDAETINFVADEFGFKTSYVSAEVMEAIQTEEDSEEDLMPRPPIVTVMGHVDHGKTSLLDYIRNTNVIAGEAGGITQHIGAYNVKLPDGRKITFLDTPGHEAFTAMRARGAQVTDIAIIIVAADDNVMPQTIEAINHATAANVPMVFAINKIDKPGADPEKIKQTLAQMNYLVEDWGGKYQSQDISAKKGIKVEELLEKVLLEAELLDLKANPDRKAVGNVIESSLDKGRGYIATILVQNGTLKIGDIVIAGTNYGRVKAMFNERGQRVTVAGPSEPVLILGLNGAPQAGDNFNVLESEQEAREITNKREQLQREQGLRTNKILTLAEIGRRIAVGNFKELNVIVKGDVDGSIEALSDSLINLSTEEIQVNVIHKAVGAISESDVTLASASDAIIIGFQVRPSQAARRLADKEGVDMRLYSIIYDAIEEVKAAMEGMLSPEIKEEITATIEIREVFKITKVGTVAGCMVKEGKVKRGNKLRLIREGIVIYTGEMSSLKRFKEEVKEVNQGYECGLSFASYQNLMVGDIVESFEEVEVRKSL